jgi:hypothetical protein
MLLNRVPINNTLSQKTYIGPKDFQWPPLETPLKEWSLNQTVSSLTTPLKKWILNQTDRPLLRQFNQDSQVKRHGTTTAQDFCANAVSVTVMSTLLLRQRHKHMIAGDSGDGQ